MKKQKYSIVAFRIIEDSNDPDEFITHSVYSHNFLNAINLMDEYILNTKTKFHSLYLSVKENSEFLKTINFKTDEDFMDFIMYFKEKAYAEGINDYKEWLLSYNKD